MSIIRFPPETRILKIQFSMCMQKNTKTKPKKPTNPSPEERLLQLKYILVSIRCPGVKVTEMKTRQYEE